MPIIALLNQKGGAGKSSTTFHLGGTLANMGRRVLLVDNEIKRRIRDAAVEQAA